MKELRGSALTTHDLLAASGTARLTMRADGEVVFETPPPLPAVEVSAPATVRTTPILCEQPDELVVSIEIDIDDEDGSAEAPAASEAPRIPVAPAQFGRRLAEENPTTDTDFRREVVPAMAYHPAAPSPAPGAAIPAARPARAEPITATARREVNLRPRRIRERTRGDERSLRPMYDARAELLYEEAAKAVARRDFVTAERHLALALSYVPNETRFVEARDKVRLLRKGRPTSSL